LKILQKNVVLGKNNILKKILVIRFSSIGDIILTTPVVRCIKNQIPDAEIHFVTKKQFACVIEDNPYISKIFTLDSKFGTLIKKLQAENYDYIIDLHNSIRSQRLILNLKKPSKSFPKLNIRKWLLVKRKLNLLPDIHVVDRYFKATSQLGIEKDQNGCDFFLSPELTLPQSVSHFLLKPHVVAIAVGSKHNTKQLPVDKIRELLSLTPFPVILLGGKEDRKKGDYILNGFVERVYNACGELSIQQSALALKQCKAIITGDTGLMHIAAALNIRIFSLWGNTVTDFGMYPYMPNREYRYDIIEVKNLKCRPCSKLGFEKCPKGHFKCMKDQDMVALASEITKYLLSLG